MSDSKPQQLYLSDRRLASRYGVARATIWAWVRDGSFPEPHKLSARCTRWRLDEVEKWEAERGVA